MGLSATVSTRMRSSRGDGTGVGRFSRLAVWRDASRVSAFIFGDGESGWREVLGLRDVIEMVVDLLGTVIGMVD